MATSPEEQALIELWRRADDQEAARQIVDRYIDRLLALARRRISQRLASRVDAEDIVQSVFRTFFVRLKDGRFTFHEEDDLCKLLVRITLHKTLRQVAFHKAAKRDPNQEAAQGDHCHERLLSVLDREPSAEDAVAFEDELQNFRRLLNPQEQQIIEMRLQGCTNDEIAQALGIYDRKIRRVIERVREVAEAEGLAAALGAPPPEEE